ncbi:MAG: hypothetical protein J6B04_06280 [Clostridia bacterium]|nr:hypothetical protein [Clostridia bacterium]
MKGLNIVKYVFTTIIIAFAIAAILSVSGVFSAWTYATMPSISGKDDVAGTVGTFDYSGTQEGTDEDNVNAINRLLQILNNDIKIPDGGITVGGKLYTKENATSFQVLQAIIDEGGGAIQTGAYVGTMDQDVREALIALFGKDDDGNNVIDDANGVTFLIKEQSVTGDNTAEYTIYSTLSSNIIDENGNYVYDWYQGNKWLNPVYVTSFTRSGSAWVSAVSLVGRAEANNYEGGWFADQNSIYTDTWETIAGNVTENGKVEINAGLSLSQAITAYKNNKKS